MKKCTKCGIPKPLKDFPHNGFCKNGKEKIGATCNACRNEYFKEYYQRTHKRKNQPSKLKAVKNEAKKFSPTPCSATCKCHRHHPLRHTGVRFKEPQNQKEPLSKR